MDGSLRFLDRFRGMSPDERGRLVAVIEEQVTVRGQRLLETREIEELLTLLSAGHFRQCFRAGLDEIRRQREPFPDKVPDFAAAAERLTARCREVFARDDAGARASLMVDLASLRVIHPALWYRVYARIRLINLSWALEMEPADRSRPFKRP